MWLGVRLVQGFKLGQKSWGADDESGPTRIVRNERRLVELDGEPEKE